MMMRTGFRSGTMRTLVFGVVFVVMVVGALLSTGEERGLALAWPAAGVAALWSLHLRSWTEALLTAVFVFFSVALCVEVIGYNVATGVSVGASNVVIFLVTRLGVDLMHGAKPFVVSEERVPWRLRGAGDAVILVTAAFIASLLAVPVAYVALWNSSTTVYANYGITLFFRNMSAIIMIMGTGAAILDCPGLEKEAFRPHWFNVFAALAPLALGAVIFNPSVTYPLLTAMLIPLFWSAIRFPPWAAMLNAMYIDTIVIVLAALVGRTPIGIALSNQGAATRVHLFIVVGGTLSLVMAAAVTRIRHQAADLALAEQTARKDAERLAIVTATVPDGLAIVHRDGAVERLNESTPGFLVRNDRGDYRLPDTVGALNGDDILDDERPSVIALMGQSSRDVPVAVEDEDGRRRIFEVSSNPLSEEFGGAVLLSFGDATERYEAIEAREKVEKALAHQAKHDSLTGLRNRSGFAGALNALIQRYRADGEDAGLLVVDLDHFKNVNDTLGHSAGDLLLADVATAILSVTREEDFAARLGGDEFAILLHDATMPIVRRVGERLVDAIARMTKDKTGEQRRVTASIGATTLSIADRMGLQPMTLADMLVYEAKAEGRNALATVDEHNPELPAMGRNLALADRLRRALDDERFELFLQPVADIRDGTIIGAEALIRLRDGESIIGPGQFMPVAESAGLAPEIDIWVFTEAIRIRKRLDRCMPKVRLSINVSGPSVGFAPYQEALEEILRINPDVSAASLILEITETASVADMEGAAEFTQWARRTGFNIALDDFGAGFGSFAYVKRLDFNFVKIDGSFVRRADTDSTDRSIIAAIVTMARDLGKRTIGEFVENERVWRAARQLGVDFIQGYAISEPLPVDEFLERFCGKTR